jgi:sterol desaturase/sphingolipid hydroxylase (fatty acid hydroxylase superfamily)
MWLFQFLLIVVQEYIVPFIFAIGLIFFIYAIIKYFILGPGEEPVREEGRQDLIKANVWFFAGLLIYFFFALLVAFFTWVGGFSVDRGEQEDILPVPDVPVQNE